MTDDLAWLTAAELATRRPEGAASGKVWGALPQRRPSACPFQPASQAPCPPARRKLFIQDSRLVNDEQIPAAVAKAMFSGDQE